MWRIHRYLSRSRFFEDTECHFDILRHPLKCVQREILLGGLREAFVRMFGGSPHFLFVFFRPATSGNVRSESRMVVSTYKRTS